MRGWNCIARSLITKAVMGVTTTNDEIVVYVKGHEKRYGCGICSWIKRDGKSKLKTSRHIKSNYEDIKSLNKLDTHTLRCQKHVKNCALQNIFKLFNWWHYHHHK